MKMLDWFEWVCEKTNHRYYESVLETHTEEELDELRDLYDEYVMEFEQSVAELYEYEEECGYPEKDDDEDYVPSVTKGDYSSNDPWHAPGMNEYDFI